MHLWEVKHPYYCADGNYYSNDRTHHFDSWVEFMAEWGDADEDYNLVFRWDWKVETDDNDDPTEAGRSGAGVIQVCYMLQRKGIYATCFVQVTAADEPAVREFIAAKANHMRRVWAPLLGDA